MPEAMATFSPQPAPNDDHADTLVGQVVADRFNVLNVVARGATGKVYRAEQLPLGRIVALKVLDPLAEHVQGSFELRFLKEAATLARLHHPNTVRVYDYGFFDGRSFLAMEYVDGRTLREVFDEGALTTARLVHIARQIAASLQEAHNAGIVHRDLKPGNVLISEVAQHEDFVKVVDFGLVKDLGDSLEMTGTGIMLGTPTYMAPEQIRGEDVDIRADIYTLGVLMFRGLTGEPLFRHAQTTGVLMAHLTAPPPTFAAVNPGLAIHPLYEWLVRSCLEKHPDDRPADMAEVIRGLDLCERASEDPACAGLTLDLIDGRIRTSIEIQEASLSRRAPAWRTATAEIGAGPPATQVSPRTLGIAVSSSFLAGILLVVGLNTRWAGTPAAAAPEPDRVRGPLVSDVTWGPETVHELDGIVFVDAGATLTITRGTTVLGRPGSALVVARGARINVRGDATAPVVFTSAAAEADRRPGDWGGISLLGHAPVGDAPRMLEGLPAAEKRAAYGGTDPMADCGTIAFARIEYAGAKLSSDNEFNGLTLAGCGSTTVIENVQVDHALDDGVEIFGGSANLRNFVVTSPGDDGLDWDLGWSGLAQNVLVVMANDRGDNAIVADGAGAGGPTLFNLTLLGGGAAAGQRGLLFRNGAEGHLANVLLGGFGREGLDVRDATTAANIRSGQLTLRSAALWALGPDGKAWSHAEPVGTPEDDDRGFDEAAWLSGDPGVKLGVPPPLAATDITAHRLSPSAASAAGGLLTPEAEFWRPATWLGAVPPDDPAPWYDGWTKWAGTVPPAL